MAVGNGRSRITVRLCKTYTLCGMNQGIWQDAQGIWHKVRTFNTETGEQFNAWMNNYEASSRQTPDTNFDMFVHVLFLLFKEDVDASSTRAVSFLMSFGMRMNLTRFESLV